jgi:hypothetical protein
MAGISIECLGADGVRIDEQRTGQTSTDYLSEGGRVDIDDAFLTQISIAESGSPSIRISNTSDDRRVDIYDIQNGATTRLRPLPPRRTRDFKLVATGRLLAIPLSVTAIARRPRS